MMSRKIRLYGIQKPVLNTDQIYKLKWLQLLG